MNSDCSQSMTLYCLFCVFGQQRHLASKYAMFQHFYIVWNDAVFV